MKRIFHFLTDIAAHNNREWFAENRNRYDEARELFARLTEDLIRETAKIDPEISAVQVKDTLYRFYRDTRFSTDKSPYKKHFGTYINSRGKNSIHGGYYFHIEPDACMISVGSYCLPSPVLRAVRQSILAMPETFHGIMTEKELDSLHPELGITRLKTCPTGFPRDFQYPEYLRPREYCLSVYVPDSFCLSPGLPQRVAHIFHLMKPFLDFVNATVDDYV